MKFTDGTIDDRTALEVSADVWSAVFHVLDECEDLNADEAGLIAQVASDLTEVALTRANWRRHD